MDIDLDKLIDTLEGTCDSIVEGLIRMGLEPENYNIEVLRDALYGANLEQCPKCTWWMESGELVDANLNVVGCPQCRPDEEDDDD